MAARWATERAAGIFGYPPVLATEVAVQAVRQDLAAHGEFDVIFACFDPPMLARYEKELAA